MPDVAHNLSAVRARIAAAAARAGRAPESVRLLAVSKTQPPEAVAAARQAGQRDFGENYLQDASPKLDAFTGQDLCWHFIGQLQSNKTREIAARFQWVHTLDREGIARRLSDQRPAALPPLEVCIQVNVSGESRKGGVRPERLPALAEMVAALPRLKLRGLMSIPAEHADEAQQRAPHRQLREMLESLNARGFNLDTLSMGMTSDLEAAVLEGSTLVRIGTAIFGPRKPKGT